MHRRKEFLVYPPNYDPMAGGIRYRTFKSKRQAWKQACRWGVGTNIMESVHVHRAPRKHWESSRAERDWWVE
jgi:hypothetical protein